MSESNDLSSGLDLAGAMEKLMAHPEIIELAASVLKPEGAKGDALPEATDPNAASTASSAEPARVPSDLSSEPSDPPSVSSIFPRKGSSAKDGQDALSGSIALLVALKPYLSPKRCETVDRLIEVGKIGKVISALR